LCEMDKNLKTKGARRTIDHVHCRGAGYAPWHTEVLLFRLSSSVHGFDLLRFWTWNFLQVEFVVVAKYRILFEFSCD
jgi:hypothetical protein